MDTDHHSRTDEAACAWIVRRESGDWTEADQATLELWLCASTSNRVAYLRLNRVWEDTRRLAALGAGVEGDEPPPRGRWNVSPFFERAGASRDRIPGVRYRRAAVAVAAGVVLIAGLAFVPYLISLRGTAYETPVGGLSSVPMSDGSKVTLNTDSEIRVSLTAAERRVELEHGEAFFEVAKDPHRPFVVNAGSKRVIAVGTRFAVRREHGDIQVVVTEGRVRVEDRPGSAASTTDRTVLSAGAIARATAGGVVVERRELPEVQEQLSWRTGLLVFRKQTLAGAIAELNRYNTRKFLIRDPSIAALRIEGTFRATNVDDFAELLQKGYSVHVEQENGDMLLTSQAQ